MRLFSLMGLFVVVAPLSLAAEPPNVVLVMADDQGWGDMAYNGHPFLKTPNFDALAREGVRFDQFHSAAPVCSPTRGSVMTGRHPNRYACFSWGHPIRPQEVTIAQTLKTAGYRTGHFGKWHIGSVQAAGKSNPGTCGFDDWVSAPNFFDLNPVLSDRGRATPFTGDSSDVTADLAVRFIRACAAKKQRFLAVVWFGSPHAPHQALDADRAHYAGKPANVQNFCGEITAMDRAFGRIRSTIKDLGLRENTILWYCSDNGALPNVGSSGGRRGQKGSVYEGGFLVPALIEWPARFASPKAISASCVTSDIYPTVMEYTGTRPARANPLDGVSLAPLLDGRVSSRGAPIGFWNYPIAGVATPSKQWMDELLAEQKQGREPADPARLFSTAGTIGEPRSLTTFPGHSAWLDGSWKLHRIETAKERSVRWELYDLGSDPKEAQDRAGSETQRMAEMQAALTTWLKSVVRSLNGDDYGK